ncbi:MAG: hypothetical protein ABIS84_11525 [Arachnia sp.]
MTDMRDIESIRPSDEAIDAEFDAQRRESVFQEVLQARTGMASIGPSRRRWPAVAAAATGLVVLGLAVQAVAPRGEPVAEPPLVTSAASSTPSLTTPKNPSLGHGSAAAMLGPVAVAAAGASAAETGTFVHVVRVEEQQDGAGQGSSEVPVTADSSVTHDDYIDAEGWLWSRRSGDQNFWLLTEQDLGTITSLPSEPDALDAALRSGTGNNSGDERVFKGVDEILRTEIAPPALRSAAITVLQRIAEQPQVVETTKDGETATPTVVVSTINLDGAAGTGYRAAMTDPTSRPGVEYWLVLDASGQIVGSGVTSQTPSSAARSLPGNGWTHCRPTSSKSSAPIMSSGISTAET